jgi:hypothetical protein
LLEKALCERYASIFDYSTRSGTVTSFLVFLAILAAIVFWGIGIYNRLVNERNRVKNAFAQIDVQLTRRYDLIPNLVEAVKGYMKHPGHQGTRGIGRRINKRTRPAVRLVGSLS